jgi:hypothetical protein
MIEKGTMEREATNMLVKNVKINKIVFVETYTHERVVTIIKGMPQSLPRG